MVENVTAAVITSEKLKGKTVYIAECPLVNVSSQGHTIEKSVENLEEAIISYLKSPFAKKLFSKRGLE
jgi:predicted RNase H-like HicB family nuclease